MRWLRKAVLRASTNSAFTAAFLASLVEFVEALTIVLAVGTTRGWRPALSGAAVGAALLVALVLAFGPLLDRIPLSWLQLVIGVLLLLFGMRWLRKAVLRAAGIIALHDETSAFADETRHMREAGASHGPWDAVALITSFKAVVLEGLEVVFIVIAIGAAGNALLPASLGAGAALLLVLILGLILHRPLALVPENGLKLVINATASHGPWDAVALITSFKAVVLEGLEVVFIVIAIGAAGNALLPASLGAGAALLLVLILGLILHRPLALVPENGLKFAVGVLLSAFGIFWIGEGVGFEWPGDDLVLLGLIPGFLAAALFAVGYARHIIGSDILKSES